MLCHDLRAQCGGGLCVTTHRKCCLHLQCVHRKFVWIPYGRMWHPADLPGLHFRSTLSTPFQECSTSCDSAEHAMQPSHTLTLPQHMHCIIRGYVQRHQAAPVPCAQAHQHH